MADSLATDSLKAVLAAIQQAHIGSALTKSLAYRAVELSMGVGQPMRSEANILVDLEVALQPFANKFGHDIDINEAVTILRQGGRGQFANRVRGLARSRNSAAHPDIDLPNELPQFLEGYDDLSAAASEAVVDLQNWDPASLRDDRVSRARSSQQLQLSCALAQKL